jgi:hypothetical protein
MKSPNIEKKLRKAAKLVVSTMVSVVLALWLSRRGRLVAARRVIPALMAGVVDLMAGVLNAGFGPLGWPLTAAYRDVLQQIEGPR